mmetsp:Transcript_26177/g.74170  ORF Transcript_26177/g.74170 Transcript_26177/m.74170 type:complete len:241 (-) Transcript_26177:494-1216(-)
MRAAAEGSVAARGAAARATKAKTSSSSDNNARAGALALEAGRPATRPAHLLAPCASSSRREDASLETSVASPTMPQEQTMVAVEMVAAAAVGMVGSWPRGSPTKRRAAATHSSSSSSSNNNKWAAFHRNTTTSNLSSGQMLVATACRKGAAGAPELSSNPFPAALVRLPTMGREAAEGLGAGPGVARVACALAGQAATTPNLPMARQGPSFHKRTSSLWKSLPNSIPSPARKTSPLSRIA